MLQIKKGYFTDMILDDFDNDGIIELITIAYQDEGDDIFYIFQLFVYQLSKKTPH